MKIWVDADSCPLVIRNHIYKRSIKLTLDVELVANRAIPIPKSKNIKMMICEVNDDAADDFIVEHAHANDLVITRDIPLAKRLVDKNICVLNDRGLVFTPENIGEKLSLRNFSYDLRTMGIFEEKTQIFQKKDFEKFANAFDRELTKLFKNQGSSGNLS